jgi:carboxylesterase type B
VSAIVRAPAGELVGVVDGAVARFSGIPYALAPVGELRFRPPVPRPRFAEPFLAQAPGATPQLGRPSLFTTIPEPSIAGEDTLQLTVTAPTATLGEAAGLPVLVWIHGGGYVTGSPASPWYDGTAFARDGVITVAISYRLGFDGFGLLDEPDANRGMLDWLCALRWVQENIASFGGDPDRVTVAGQSAGGAAVLALLASPAAQSLFARAVSISGLDASIDLEDARRTTALLAADLGVAATPAGFAAADPLRLQQAVVGWAAAHPENAALPFAPVHGLGPLPTAVRDALGSAGTDIPLLLGSTLDEFDSPGWPELAAAAGVPIEPAPPTAGPRITDLVFRATCARVATQRAEASAPTWLYSFNWVSPTLRGAGHCIDLPFFFDLLDADGVPAVLGTEPPQALADRMHGDLLAFVRGAPLPWAPARGSEGDVGRRYGVESGHRDIPGLYDDARRLLEHSDWKH